MDAASQWMIYGANGFTGRRIAQAAVARGLRPLVAGRDRAAIEALAAELHCPARVFSLEESERLREGLAGCRLVLHCAGPFSATSEPMREACLAVGSHYLDITGEWEVIAAAADHHEAAVAAGVILLPAVGFDVVPSDCLAALLAARMPEATLLQLAFAGVGPPSPGTLQTMLERLYAGGRARVDGQIVQVPLAWKTLKIPFRTGPQAAMTIPWGDVASAGYSTGIPNIEVYMAMPSRQLRWINRFETLLPLLKNALAQSVMRPVLQRMIAGREATDTAEGPSSFWGRVSDAAGHSLEATLTGPNSYRLTVLTALAAVQQVLAGSVPPGFATPSKAFGAEFILGIEGMEVQWGSE